MGRPLLKFPRFQSPNAAQQGDICNKRTIPFVTPSTERRAGTGLSVKNLAAGKGSLTVKFPKAPWNRRYISA
jgi:hypothetical protein